MHAPPSCAHQPRVHHEQLAPDATLLDDHANTLDSSTLFSIAHYSTPRNLKLPPQICVLLLETPDETRAHRQVCTGKSLLAPWKIQVPDTPYRRLSTSATYYCLGDNLCPCRLDRIQHSGPLMCAAAHSQLECGPPEHDHHRSNGSWLELGLEAAQRCEEAGPRVIARHLAPAAQGW